MNTIEEVTIYKNLELSLRREVWRLDLSPLHISLGRLFPIVTVGEESMLVPQICVYETWSFRMWVPVWGGWRLGCQQGWELSNAEWWLGPSHDDPLEVPSQSVPALPKNTTGTAVYFLGCHHCAGHFLVFGASYAGGKHRLEHVDTTMYFYGEIRQCTCNWQWKLLLVWLTVSRVGDIHWRFIAGSWHFNMWMEGHRPLLFPILYHILKFISVSLGTDLSRGSHLWIVWCVMGVFVEADRWSTQGTTSVRAQFLVCYARSHRFGTWRFPFKTNSFIPVIEKRSDPSRGTAIDADS